MTSYEQVIEDIRAAVAEPEDTAELQIERKCDGIIRELDELCKLASNYETVDLVEGQRVAIGQMTTRVQLIASFLMARKTGSFRMIRNG